MKNILKLTFLLFGILLATNSFAGMQRTYGYSDEVEIKKEFTVDPNMQLYVENKYGNVTIITGKQNEVIIEVTIEIKTSREKYLEEIKRGIDIKIYKSGNRVSAITSIDLHDISSSSYKINYVITAPSDYVPTIINKYGFVKMGTVTAKSDINVKYGNLMAEKLVGNSDIEVKYGNIAVRELYGTSEIEVKYGDLRVVKAEKIVLTSGYGKVDIEEINTMDIYELKYGSINIDKLNISFDCDEIRYSKLYINSCSEKLKKINVYGRYSPIRIVIPQTLQFSADLTTKYAKITNEHSSRMVITEIAAGSGTVKRKEKTKGAGSDAAVIKVLTTYSNIRIL